MSAEQAKERYQEASRLFAEGRIAEARKILEKLAKAYPANAQVHAALARCQDATPSKNKAKSPWPLVAAGVAVLLVVAGIAYWAGTRNTRTTSAENSLATSESARTSNAAISTSKAVASSGGVTPSPPPMKTTDDKWAWMNDVGPRTPPLPAPKKGEYDEKLCIEVRTIQVPHEKYPGGVCDIQIPTDDARKQYLEQTEFIPSPLKGLGIELAQANDINHDTTKYGYAYSTKPAAYVPKIGYDPNDTPIYYFAGQKVPGTNHWLIDTLPDGRTVPALTTIPFHWFRSINWPRERYLSGIRIGKAGKLTSSISDKQRNAPTALSGTIEFTGDTRFPEEQTVTIQAGTLALFPAKQDDNPTYGGENQIHLLFAGVIRIGGTAQRPVIFTSDAELPAGYDWFGINIEPAAQGFQEYALFEYAGRALGAFMAEHPISTTDCIFRYSFLPTTDLECIGIIDQQCRNHEIQHNELHHHAWGIHALQSSANITRNLIYAPRKDSGGRLSNAIHCLGSTAVISENTLSDFIWAVEIGLGQPKIQNNAIFDNDVGIMFYLRDGPQSPSVVNNRLWHNSFANHAQEQIHGKWEEAVVRGGLDTAEELPLQNPFIRDYRLAGNKD